MGPCDYQGIKFKGVHCIVYTVTINILFLTNGDASSCLPFLRCFLNHSGSIVGKILISYFRCKHRIDTEGFFICTHCSCTKLWYFNMSSSYFDSQYVHLVHYWLILVTVDGNRGRMDPSVRTKMMYTHIRAPAYLNSISIRTTLIC